MSIDLIIRKCSVAEMEKEPNIHELLEEYAQESSIEGLPHPSAKAEVYKSIENIGSLYAIGAFYNDVLIGFVNVLTSSLPHYSTVVAVVESIFVAKKHRKTGAGLKLIHEAECYAKSIGSPGILISAPYGGILAEVLPNIGYIETNRVFFKRSCNA